MQFLLNILLNSCFTFYIPVWSAFIALIIACFLLHWDKKVEKLQINGKPEPFNITHNSFEVRWNRPTFTDPSDYTVYLKKASETDNWESYTTTDRKCSIKFTNLSINTKFIVRVRARKGTENGPIGDKSDVITTKNLAFKLRQTSQLLHVAPAMQGALPKYAVKYEVEEYTTIKIRKLTIGEAPEDDHNDNRKTIVIFSSPYSGKTTLLQGIMNHIVGVSSTDNFRMCFSPEITNKSEEYLDWVTVYNFQEYAGGRLDFPLTVIDIPRLRGSKKEHFREICEQLKFILRSHPTGIDCICFVAHANNFFMPSEQTEYIRSLKYLFHTQSAAGYRYICCFFTFSDAGPPQTEPLLDSNNTVFRETYPVNWSNLFQKIDSSSLFFWKMNTDSLNKFFTKLQTSATKYMLINIDGSTPTPARREYLKKVISNLQPEVGKHLANLGEMKTYVEIFTYHKENIIFTGDFSFTIEEIQQTKEPLQQGKHVTNCMQCFFTCHETCNIPDDDGKIRCSSMQDGFCTVCTGRCRWDVHKNTPYIFRYTSVQVTKSYKEMKSSYEKEKGRPLDFDDYLEQLNKDIEALLNRLYQKVNDIRDSKNELQGISKSPLAGSFSDTIDDMIESEKMKREKGYERRIVMFLELKQYADMIRIRRR